MLLALLVILYFLPLYKSDSLDDESEKLGSDSVSYVTFSFCPFSLRFEESVVGVLGSEILNQQESSPKLVNSFHYFGAQISDFSSKFQNQFYSYSLNLRSQRLQLLYFFQKYYMLHSNGQHLYAF